MIDIIAEAGVNHNGSVELAAQLIDAAAAAGADFVKFQTFHGDLVATSSSRKTFYQEAQTGSAESQAEMLKRLELDAESHHLLRDHAEKRGIRFLSTPFDAQSIELLVSLGLETLKISSGDVTNGPHLLQLARSGCSLIFSTGMSTLDEVRAALKVMAYGLLNPTGNPSVQSLEKAFEDPEGQRLLRQKVTLLHCTTDYPAPLNEVNLLAMDLMREQFGLRVGYSDHTAGIATAVAAAARGAVIIEKHLTLDRNLPGPDHRASLEPGELKEMVAAIRGVEAALGEKIKISHSSEDRNRPIVRRSLVAASRIEPGEVFTEQNVAIKRPEAGISPMKYWELLGRKASRRYEAEDLIEEVL